MTKNVELIKILKIVKLKQEFQFWGFSGGIISFKWLFCICLSLQDVEKNNFGQKSHWIAPSCLTPWAVSICLLNQYLLLISTPHCKHFSLECTFFMWVRIILPEGNLFSQCSQENGRMFWCLIFWWSTRFFLLLYSLPQSGHVWTCLAFWAFLKTKETKNHYFFVSWNIMEFETNTKVTYPKYSKHWPCTVARTIDCVCSKILNHGLDHGLLFLLSSFLVKKTL